MDDDHALIDGEGNASQRGACLDMFFCLLEREHVPRPEVKFGISDDGRTLSLSVQDGGDSVTAVFRFAEPVAEQELLRCLTMH
jgi:hypothetical protein